MNRNYTVQQWLNSIFDDVVRKQAIDNAIIQNGLEFLDTVSHVTELKVIVTSML